MAGIPTVEAQGQPHVGWCTYCMEARLRTRPGKGRNKTAIYRIPYYVLVLLAIDHAEVADLGQVAEDVSVDVEGVGGQEGCPAGERHLADLKGRGGGREREVQGAGGQAAGDC